MGDSLKNIGLFIYILIIILILGVGIYGNIEQDLHGHYEYIDMQGNKGISEHCRKYDYKQYALECDTENGIQQVQAFNYIRDKE